MSNTILVRATAADGDTEVQALIHHPMDSGFIKDKQGKLIPPHYIEVVEFACNGNIVLTALWGPAISKDPFIKFKFKGGKTGDTLTISWIDNEGQKASKSASIT